MEEKCTFENVRTKAKKSFIFIIILAILAYVGLMAFMYYESNGPYTDHVVYEYHYSWCFNDKGQAILEEDNYSGEAYERAISTEGVDFSNCEYNKFDNSFEFFIYELSTSMQAAFTIISLVCLLVVLACVSGMCLTKCKFSVTENNIYGKKGLKKFDIAYDDIVEISKKGKKLIVKTINKKLTIAPIKNCDEIYNSINSRMPEKAINQQSTGTVDDIKLF